MHGAHPLEPRPERTFRERRLRLLAAALASGSAASHLLLSVSNVIPGEPTAGPTFAALGLGYLVVAAFVLRGGPWLDRLAALYTLALVLAYVASRLPLDTPLPIEPIGVATKVDETALLVVLAVLSWRHRPAG